MPLPPLLPPRLLPPLLLPPLLPPPPLPLPLPPLLPLLLLLCADRDPTATTTQFHWPPTWPPPPCRPLPPSATLC